MPRVLSMLCRLCLRPVSRIDDDTDELPNYSTIVVLCLESGTATKTVADKTIVKTIELVLLVPIRELEEMMERESENIKEREKGSPGHEDVTDDRSAASATSTVSKEQSIGHVSQGAVSSDGSSLVGNNVGGEGEGTGKGHGNNTSSLRVEEPDVHGSGLSPHIWKNCYWELRYRYREEGGEDVGEEGEEGDVRRVNASSSQSIRRWAVPGGFAASLWHSVALSLLNDKVLDNKADEVEQIEAKVIVDGELLSPSAIPTGREHIRNAIASIIPDATFCAYGNPLYGKEPVANNSGVSDPSPSSILTVQVGGEGFEGDFKVLNLNTE